jgi:hypothetical protein
MKRTHILLLPTLAILILLVGMLGLVGADQAFAHADSTTVTNCQDSGPGSLRNTLASAARGSTITFRLSCTIKLKSTLIIRTTNLTLDGKGQRVTLDGQNRVKVLKVNNGVTFTLNALTIAHGAAFSGGGLLNLGRVRISNSTFANNSASEDGGGLFNNDGGIVTISNSSFTNNTGGEFGGGLDNSSGGRVTISNSTFANNTVRFGDGGGLATFGTVTIGNSTFANNTASENGGGLFNNIGTVTISNSTFAHNSARNGGGLINFGAVTISNSTFAHNSTTDGDGGGLDNDGTMTISNSTVANNSAHSGGGLATFGGTVSISNSTVANNSARFSGGGIENDLEGTVSIGRSIVAKNSGGNCAGRRLNDQGFNLSSDPSCHLSASTSLQNIDPKLDPSGLQNNGGPTQTLALQPESPAVDRLPVGSGCPATDQRGVARPQGPKCDIGAFEMTTVDGLTVMIHVVNSFHLNKGLQTSLDSQLQTILADLRARHTAQACRDLTSFINHVKAQLGKGLTRAQATTLLKEAAVIHTRLGC